MKKNTNVLDILLDETNKEDLILKSEDGDTHQFSQVAVIPYEKTVYAILHPSDTEDNIAYVFKVKDNYLFIEEDEKIATNVFNQYLDLLKESQGGI